MGNKNLMPVFDSQCCPYMAHTVFFWTLYFSRVQNLCKVFSGIIVFMILGLLLNGIESEILSPAKYTINLLAGIYKEEKILNVYSICKYYTNSRNITSR